MPTKKKKKRKAKPPFDYWYDETADERSLRYAKTMLKTLSNMKSGKEIFDKEYKIWLIQELMSTPHRVLVQLSDKELNLLTKQIQFYCDCVLPRKMSHAFRSATKEGLRW